MNPDVKLPNGCKHCENSSLGEGRGTYWIAAEILMKTGRLLQAECCRAGYTSIAVSFPAIKKTFGSNSWRCYIPLHIYIYLYIYILLHMCLGHIRGTAIPVTRQSEPTYVIDVINFKLFKFQIISNLYNFKFSQ